MPSFAVPCLLRANTSGAQSMLGIEWLRNGSVVDREASVLKTEGKVIANAYARAPEVAARLIGHEPDGFRLKDASGNDLSLHSLGAIRGR